MLNLVEEQLQVIAAQIEKQVNMAITLNVDRINLIKSRTQLRRSLKHVLHTKEMDSSVHLKKISAIIHDAKNSVKDIERISVTDSTGMIVQSTDSTHIGQQLALDWFTSQAEHVQLQVIDDRRNATLRFADNLVIDGIQLGFIIVDVDTSAFEHALYNQHDWSTSLKALLFYRDDSSIPAPLLLSQKLVYEPTILAQYVTALENTLPHQILEVSVTSTEQLAILSPIENISWGLVLHIEKDEALQLLSEQSRYLIFSGLAISILLLVISIFVGRHITKPIVDMVYVAQMISSGDFSKRIEKLTNDELGMLGSSLNKMADSLINANLELDKKVKEKTYELHLANQHLLEVNTELEEITLLDPLTKIYNRRAFSSTLSKELKRAMRDNTPLSLFFLDVDYFKKFNDNQGHSKGDECLVQIGSLLKQTAGRENDFVARYGGEEFVMLFPNTNAEASLQIANTLQTKLKQLAIPHPESNVSDVVTISIGIRVLQTDESIDEKKFIEQADIALYSAKEKGRNRTEVFLPTS